MDLHEEDMKADWSRGFRWWTKPTFPRRCAPRAHITPYRRGSSDTYAMSRTTIGLKLPRP